eukprot:13003393-Alexandrium_andersonii.AAC.1
MVNAVLAFIRIPPGGRVEPHHSRTEIHDAECIPLPAQTPTLTRIDGFNFLFNRNDTDIARNMPAKRVPEETVAPASAALCSDGVRVTAN